MLDTILLLYNSTLCFLLALRACAAFGNLNNVQSVAPQGVLAATTFLSRKALLSACR